MNNQRRVAILALKKRFEDEISEAIGKLERDFQNFVSDLDNLKDEEQEYYDNMPEGLQNSERGENAQAAIEAMESVEESITTLLDALGDVDVSGLEDAASY